MHRRWLLIGVVACLTVAEGGCRRHYAGQHRHGYREVAQGVQDIDKYVVVDAKTGIQYNPYSKHHPGRHMCPNRKQNQPMKTQKAFCKPVYKKYTVPCASGTTQLCTALKVSYETHYKDVYLPQNTNEVTYSCCPGWTQISNRSHGCNKPKCTKPCLNGGKCVKPELCGCLKGFSGVQCEIEHRKPVCSKGCENGGRCTKNEHCSCPRGFGGAQCEINLNKPYCTKGCHNGGTCIKHETCKCVKGFTGRHCEIDMDECKEEKPCDQICHNTYGSYNCQCREDFVLLADGQSCRKEENDTPIEANGMEFEEFDKRLSKLETMMDESHKNEVSKSDIQNIYKDIEEMSKDVYALKSKVDDMENYKRDMHTFKNKLNDMERKADKVNDMVSYHYDGPRHWATKFI